MNNGLHGFPEALPDPRDFSTRGNTADRPPPCMVRDGTFFYARDAFTLWRCNGVTWEAVAVETN